MSAERKLTVIDDAVPQDLMLDLMEEINSRGWTYGWHSTGKKRYCHWNQTWGGRRRKNREDVEDALPPAVEAVWRHLETTCLKGMTLIRAYANAYTYGTEGYSHRDSEDPQDRTIVLYCNPEWSRDYGGETVFFNAAGDTVKAVSPKWARVAIFPSNWMHAARSVSRDCVFLRVVTVLKCRAPDEPS